jgi:glycosyltransferase involved in cell wall biosynthesis
MKVLHVITGLGAGGAEAMLCKLVAATRGALAHHVVSLLDGGPLRGVLAAQGIPVETLGMRRGAPRPAALARLARIVARERPDAIQGWMDHANLLAGLAGALTRVPVVWGVHHADVDPRHAKRLTHWTRAVSARLSGTVPAQIVCCATSALRAYAALGYRRDRMVVIPNGFALERWAPSAEARRAVREELAVGDAPLVGIVARVHPDKDHQSFLAAAALVAREHDDAAFILAGEGTAADGALVAAIARLGLGGRVRLLGPRSDVPRLLAALDVLASSSRSEGFPQILGEAMLCGVPCAATDCGDSREILGATGRIVSPGDPAALAGAIGELLALDPAERAALGEAARRRIVERYDIHAIARRYVELYEDVTATLGSRGSPASSTPL